MIELQVEVLVSLLTQSWFSLSLLISTWAGIGIWFLKGRRGGPKTGPTSTPGSVSFNIGKSKLSEEEIFKILTTTEVNIQIVRICEDPRSAREISKALGEVYPGHREKGFPADKLGEHLANLERLGAVKFNGDKWEASDVGVKMVRKYFG
jgi:hypothetical protein